MNQLTLVIIKNPFDIERDRVVRELSFVPGQPVFDYLRGSYPAEPAEIDIVHNGRILADDEYGRTTPGPGDFIVAMPRVAKGSSKSKNILSMVASIGLMMLSMGVGNLVESGLWRGIGVSWSNPWSYAAAMATNLVGGIAMSHWFPPAKLDMKQESLTYGWNGVQNQIGQGNPVQITFGRVRTGGQLLQSHVSVEDDKQYLNLLFCGGEGPCQYDGDGESNPDDPDDAVDHVPGIAAIQINGNPLENYSGVKVYKRAGLNHQSVIPGFADAYVEQPLSFALSAEYATATTTGDNVQGLEIALDFPTGLYRMDDGEVKSGQFRAEIQYRLHDAPEGSAWNTKEWSFSRSTRMPFKSTISIDHLNPGQYDVRVKCLAKPNSELVIQWSNLAQIIYDDFVRPGKILLAIKALATDQLSGGLPTVTWEQTRDQVWVWNPRGAAGGCYETRDADNPAWACYWLIHRLYRLTDSRTGVRHDVVRGVPADRIDYDAFAEWARCCDGVRLDDPAGTPDPKRRLRVNLVLDTAQNLWEALRLIAPLGRGNVFLKGTRYSCVCDQPGQPVVQLFNMANIGLNSFNEQFADTKDRANAIEVTFFNKGKDYQRDTITVYAADYNTAATVQNPTQVTLRGCVTLEQAYRHGRYLLRTNRYNTRTCSWSAEADSIACTIGDVVAVQHDVPLWGAGGRIVAAEAGGVTLDRPVRLDEGQSYALKVRLADDTLVDKALVNTCPGGESFIETAALQVITPFDAVPAAGDLYSFGAVQKVAKPFKILSITKDHVNQRRKISALEYNEAVYDESGDEPPALNYSAGKEALSGLIASHHMDGTGAVWLDIAWTPSRGMYYGAQVEIDGRKVQKIEAPQAAFSWQVGVPGQYAIRVAALDQFGNPCGAATLTYTATAKPAPADVSEVRLSENTFLLRDGTALSDIRVSFRPSGEIVREFRVYYALDGSAVWNFAGATPEPAYTIKAIPNTQTVTVKVCAVDRLGNESAGTVSEAFRLTGKSDPPGDVAGLTAVQDDYNRARVILTWPALDPVLHPDLRGYEVRVGASWSAGTKIGGLTTDLTSSYTVPASGNYAFWVKGVDNSGNSSVNAAGKSLYVEAKPNAPTAGTVLQDANDRSNLLISWSAVSDKDLAAYEVRLGNSWDSGAAVGVTKETGLQYRIGASGVYNFMICSRNTAGFRSTVLNLAFNAGVEPSNVTGFVVEQSDTDRRILKCRWTGIADKDLAYYEIRKGALWNSAAVVATKIGNPYYDDVATAEETATFLIKAVNKAGFASNDPAAQIVSVTLTPNQPGGGSVLSDYDNRLKLKVSWEKVPDLDIDYYELKYENTVIARTSETSYPFAVGSGGVHHFAARSRNKAGFYSSALNLAITIQAEPAAVTGFTIQQSPLDRRILQFAWNPVADSDLSHYEIRKGANWDSAAVFATGLKTTALEKMVTAEETANFLIKAITSGGVGSANAAAKSLAIALKPSKPGPGTIAPSPANHAQLVLTWQPVADTDLVNYEIRRGGAWESATLIGTTRESSYTYSVTASGSYTFLICAKNVGGLYSNPLSLATVANIEPSDVAGFAAEQWGNDRSKVRLTWNAIPDLDLDYYEIREGANWDLGTVVATRLTGLVCDASIAAERLYRFWIAAVNKAGKTSLNPAPVEGRFDLNPSPPQGLTVAADPNDRSNLQIAWTGITDLDLQDYSLKVGLDWDSGAEIARTKELKTAWKPPASGTYKFMLRARNNAGFESDEIAAVFEARIEPADVTGFVAYQNGTVVAMSWDKSLESDVVAYEIREGATFDNGAALVVTGLSETSYSVAVDTETSKRYHIKAINRAGYYSREAASAGVTIANLPPKNVMFDYNEIELQDGSHENTEFGESQFNYANFGGRFMDYPNIKFAEVGGQTVLKLKKIPITFSRNSMAYLTDGTAVGIDQPRFETVDGKAGIFVEEGTTNLITSGAVDASGLAPMNYSGSSITRTIVQDNFFGTVINVSRVVNATSNGDFRISITTAASVKGRAFTGSIWLRSNTGSNQNLALWFAQAADTELTVSYITVTPTWQRFTINHPSFTQDGMQLRFYVAGFKEISACYAQIEEKPYATSFTINTRNSEDLSVPMDGMSPSKGTIEITANINARFHSATNPRWSMILSTGKIPGGTSLEVNQISFRRSPNSTRWSCVVSNSAGTTYSIPFANVIPDGIHRFKFCWDETGGKAYLDNVLVGTCDASYLPNQFESVLYVGRWIQGGLQINSYISDLRLSNIARTDAPDLTKPLPVDEYTVAKYDFTSSLDAFYKSGTYLCARKDMGSVITANIVTQFVSTVLLRSGVSAKLQYRVSRDGTLWTEWQDFAPVLTTFRYAEFRVLLNASDTARTPEVNILREIIDVPDVDRYGAAVIPAGGTDVAYGRKYWEAPVVNPAAIGPGLRAELISVGKEQFRVRVLNAAGADVGGTINWLARGF